MVDKNAVFNYEHQFYLDGILLSGVTNVDGGYSIDESPIHIIGKGYAYPVRQGPLVGNFSISKYYIGKDSLLNYTGQDSFSASINYGDSSFGFQSGYLSEYSISAGIGQIPQSNASITTYGDFGSGISSEGTAPNPPIQIPNQGSITLNTDGYENNRVSSFSYTMRINREPLYQIGSVHPVQVDIQYPIFQEISVSMEINDYEVDNITSYLTSPKQKDISISFKNPINDHEIETFEIKKSRLLSQSISSSSDDVLSVDLVYNGYINKK